MKCNSRNRALGERESGSSGSVMLYSVDIIARGPMRPCRSVGRDPVADRRRDAMHISGPFPLSVSEFARPAHYRAPPADSALIERHEPGGVGALGIGFTRTLYCDLPSKNISKGQEAVYP